MLETRCDFWQSIEVIWSDIRRVSQGFLGDGAKFLGTCRKLFHYSELTRGRLCGLSVSAASRWCWWRDERRFHSRMKVSERVSHFRKTLLLRLLRTSQPLLFTVGCLGSHGILDCCTTVSRIEQIWAIAALFKTFVPRVILLLSHHHTWQVVGQRRDHSIVSRLFGLLLLFLTHL